MATRALLCALHISIPSRHAKIRHKLFRKLNRRPPHMAQSLSRLWTHLIFSTKNRFPFLSDKAIRTDMHEYLATMLRARDCETLIVNGVEDHVHALFALSRTHSIASVVKEIKRTSSGWIKESLTKSGKVPLARRLRSIFSQPIEPGGNN